MSIKSPRPKGVGMRSTEDAEVGYRWYGNAKSAECSEDVWGVHTRPAESVEPVEDQNAKELHEIVQKP